MSDCFDFHEGSTPLLISVPHDGRELPPDVAARMTQAGLAIPDTDWHVAKLYEFAREMGAATIVARYSRYIVDLNRSASDENLYPGQVATGLCPSQTFSGEAIYKAGAAVSADEQGERIEHFWRPYHDKIRTELETLMERHGVALLWDAHSIPSVVPRLFDGELPQLNIGTWDGRSCEPGREQAVAAIAHSSAYESVLNGRFKGGYITRHYGDPGAGAHAIQLEISQRAYMDEGEGRYDDSKACELQKTLKAMLGAFTIQP